MNESFTGYNPFEVHITLEVSSIMLPAIETAAMYYKGRVSKIDGDPLLGAGVKTYITLHANTLSEANTKRMDLVQALRDIKDIKILRSKIEEVVFDERY